jgi:hypothetical protein
MIAGGDTPRCRAHSACVISPDCFIAHAENYFRGPPRRSRPIAGGAESVFPFHAVGATDFY